MTTQEKIEVLERAIPLIDVCRLRNKVFRYGICRAIFESLNHQDIEQAYTDSESWEGDAKSFLRKLNIRLPKYNYYDKEFSWPVSEGGDEERRNFLRGHIERLRKELETEKA